MADYNISQTDINILRANKKIHLRAYLLNENNQPIDELQGYILSGDGSDDASSDVRKSCNFDIHSYDSSYNIGEYNRIWLNNRVRIELGFQYFDTIYYYTKGTYIFDSCSYTYDVSTKDITFSCSDLTTSINGTHGGTLDGESFLIAGCVYDETTDTWTGNDIKQVVEDLLIQNGITEFRVDTIGQVSCLQGYATNWKENRMMTGTSQSSVDEAESNGFDNLTNDQGMWHMIPYDLEFSSGTDLWSVLVKIRDLYSGYEMFFDKDGMFIFQLIPICHHDVDVLDYTQLEGLVISEKSDIDLTTVRNATRVYGESIEAHRYSSNTTLSEVLYNETTVTSVVTELSDFTLINNAIIGVTFPTILSDNLSNIAYITIGEETYPITKRGTVVEYDENGIPKNTIVYNETTYADFNSQDVYCFKFMSYQKMWTYLGMYQIEGYCENNDENSPFAISKIGYRLQVKSGNEYDDITSSILAQERAEYENWLASRLNDSLNLETVIIPFLEVNQKIQYRKLSDGSIDSYIIKNISYSFTEGTMSITMMKFYELDPFIVCS